VRRWRRGKGGDDTMTQPAYKNLIGTHGLVWAGGWSETEARYSIESTKAAGFDLIEILFMNPRAIDAPMTRRLLDEYGVVASASLGLSLDTDVSSEDPARVKAGEVVLHDALEAAKDVGLIYLGGVLFGALSKYSQPATPRGRENSIGAVRRLCDSAEDSGITIGLEIVNRYESNLLNTARQAVAYVREVDRPNLVIHLDTYHMNIEEVDNYAAVLECGDLLGYVHIGESHRGYLGSGSVDFEGLFRGLGAIGYQGPITFESFSSKVVMPELSHTLAIWRDLWDDSMDLATQARGFIDAQLRAVASTRHH
jgi:D-psicose/D-tagatose/L-ribulose 3-epimerase